MPRRANTRSGFASVAAVAAKAMVSMASRYWSPMNVAGASASASVMSVGPDA